MIDKALPRFLVAGVCNTVLGLGVIYAFRQFTSDLVANLVGYVIVVPVSFLTHRGWSFRDAGRLLPTFLRFMPSVLIGYSANVAILKLGLSAGLDPYVTQASAIGVYVGIVYLLSRFVVFVQPR